MSEIWGRFNRVKNVLCKRGMVESINSWESTTPWETKAGSELGGKRNNWALCPAQANMGQEIRAQKSPCAMSRGRAASEQLLQIEKSPFHQVPHLSAGWCLPSNYFCLQAQLQHRLGDAQSFVCQATTAPLRLWAGLDPLWSTSKNSSTTYLRHRRPAGSLGGIYLLSWAKETPKIPKKSTEWRISAFVHLVNKTNSSNSFVNKCRAPRQCRWFIGT